MDCSAGCNGILIEFARHVLVGSGVLTSVHAFASDPERGLFILLFMMLVVGGSLLLFAVWAASLKSVNEFGLLVSRESGLLFNNVLLVVACASVLIGTLYPLLLDALQLGKILVGAPWFNFVFVLRCLDNNCCPNIKILYYLK